MQAIKGSNKRLVLSGMQEVVGILQAIAGSFGGSYLAEIRQSPGGKIGN